MRDLILILNTFPIQMLYTYFQAQCKNQALRATYFWSLEHTLFDADLASP